MISKTCLVCGKEFKVPPVRGESAKYCSQACSAAASRAKPNTVCTNCGKEFHMKESRKRGRKRTLGYFCSARCNAEYKSVGYSGEKNPNWRGRTHDYDGYRIIVPPASLTNTTKKIRLHTAVCLEVLGVDSMPKGVHIHHRDCNVENNIAENLCVLSISDHKWLHKQYGVATLWAFVHGKVSLEDLVSWSDDKPRAKRLLPLNVTAQSFANDNFQSGENNESENQAA